jgi:uncharacterized cupin superfamily protein
MTEYVKLDAAALPDAPSPTSGKKEIDEAVGASEFGFNLYLAEPGQQLSMGYHHHPDHEELFYVLDGEVTFETPDGGFAVGAGEVFFVPPGAPQKGRATSDTPARFLAIGAPKAQDHAVIVEYCPDCETETERDLEMADGAVVVSCADCGAVTGRFTAGAD